MKAFRWVFLTVAFGCLLSSCSTAPLDGAMGDPLDGYGRSDPNKESRFRGEAGVDMATEF